MPKHTVELLRADDGSIHTALDHALAACSTDNATDDAPEHATTVAHATTHTAADAPDHALVAAHAADSAMAVAALSPLAGPAQISDDVVALYKAREAVLAARYDVTDDAFSMGMFCSQVRMIAGQPWCPVVTEILTRLAGKVPITLITFTVINVSHRYRQALDETPAAPADHSHQPSSSSHDAATA